MGSKICIVKENGEIEELIYSLSPKEALKNAYFQYVKKRWDTWNYPKELDVPIVEGPRLYSICLKDMVISTRKDPSIYHH